MKKARATSSEALPLRQRAEQKLRAQQKVAGRTGIKADVRALVHELEVHQVELEMQNEELRRAKVESMQVAEKYAELFDFATVGCFVLAPQGLIREVNLAGAALLGLSPRDFLGQSFERYVIPDARTVFNEFCRHLRTGQGRHSCEVRLLRHGHGPCDTFIEGTVADDESGPGRGLRLAVMDVTRRKRAEAELRQFNLQLEQRVAARTAELHAANNALRAARVAALNLAEDAVEARERAEQVTARLRASEDRLRLAAEATGFGSYDFDVPGGCLIWTPQLFAIVGLPEATELSPERILGLVHPDDRREVERHVAQALDPAGPGRHEHEFRIVRPDGEIRWVLDTGRTIFGEREGVRRPIRAIGTVLDITARKQAEEGLRENERQFRALAESIPNLAWWANGDGYITWYNRRWYEYTGTTPEQMEGWGWRSVHDPEMLPRVMERWLRSIATGEPFEMEFPLRGADGRFRWFLTRIIPVKDAEGKVLRWFGTNTDVTERKEFEAGLERLVAERTARLQEIVNELRHVSYAIVHDMRAPLRAMRGFADLLAGAEPAEREDYCRRIVEAARRIDLQITDALQYTTAVIEEVPLQPVELSKLISGLLESYPNLHPDKAQVEIQGDLPVVLGNESLLVQCFGNLLGNAVKFVSPGTRPFVRIRAEQANDRVRIWIEDNGIGIPKYSQERVFGMFQRLASGYEGTGIGLAIVRKVVDRMGGRVGVESEEHKGSRFWVELKTA